MAKSKTANLGGTGSKIKSAKWLRFGKLNPKIRAFIKDPKHWDWLNKHIKEVYDPKKHTINFSSSPYALAWGKLHRDVLGSVGNKYKMTTRDAVKRAKQYNKMKKTLGGKKVKWNAGNVIKAWNGGAFEVSAHPDGTNK